MVARRGNKLERGLVAAYDVADILLLVGMRLVRLGQLAGLLVVVDNLAGIVLGLLRGVRVRWQRQMLGRKHRG
jgi:hypothetical protein